MPMARMITVPASEYYRLRSDEKLLRPIAEAAVDKLIDGLRRPLTSEEASATAKKEVIEPVTVSADNYAHAMQKFNQVGQGRGCKLGA